MQQNADPGRAKPVIRLGPWCLLRSSSIRQPAKCAILSAGSLLLLAGALITFLTTEYLHGRLSRGFAGMLFLWSALSAGRSALGAGGIVFRVDRVSSSSDGA